jgi:hypothetical protein
MKCVICGKEGISRFQVYHNEKYYCVCSEQHAWDLIIGLFKESGKLASFIEKEI